MLLLGIDVGTSFIKVSAVVAETKKCIATAQYPDSESPIVSLHAGWQSNHRKYGGNIR